MLKFFKSFVMGLLATSSQTQTINTSTLSTFSNSKFENKADLQNKDFGILSLSSSFNSEFQSNEDLQDQDFDILNLSSSFNSEFQSNEDLQDQDFGILNLSTSSNSEFQSNEGLQDQDTNHYSNLNISTDTFSPQTNASEQNNTFSAETSQLNLKVAATNLAYKVNKKDFSGQIEVFIENNKGWQVITDSTKSPDTNKCHYKAVALINPESKEVCIATAGTKMTDAWDLYDDASLAMGYLPSKIKPMAKFIDNVLKELPGDPTEYTFSTAGHSLGAVMTHLTACEIASRGLKVSECVSFDTPGSKHVVQKAIKEKVFTGSQEIDLDKIDIVEFNAKPNLINRGLPHEADEFNVNISKKLPQEETKSAHWLKKFGLGEILKLEEHKLSEFEKAKYARVDGWQNAKDAPLFAASKKDLELIRNSKAEMVTLFEDAKENDDVVEIVKYDHEMPYYPYVNNLEGSWMGIDDYATTFSATPAFDSFSI